MNKNNIIITCIIIAIFSITFYLSYTLKLSDLNQNFIHLITNKFNKQNENLYKIDFLDIYTKKLKSNNHFNLKINKNDVVNVDKVVYNTTEPTIYLYSTHSNEEYSYTKNDIYNIVPTVKTASYILEDELKKLGYNCIVEEKNTIDILNSQGLLYKDSYKVSRTLLENKKKEYDSLNYFIDIHRDSVKRSVTTKEIDGVSYARIMFVLGLENENYLENKKMMTEINNYLNENYEGLSRGIYEKKGSGVNGIYNQDFSPNTILIEVGGIDNTIEEVANSLKIVAASLYDYINNHKTTN